MKLHEILSESPNKEPLRKSFKKAIPNLAAYTQLDNNNHPYLAYRFGVALAVSPFEDMPREGPIGSKFVIADYTEEENDIRKGAEKIMNMKHTNLSDKGSKETDSTNTKSVVAKKKKNKYGV